MTVDMNGLTPDTQDAWSQLLDAAKSELGFDLVPRSARRTCAEQADQYAIGRLANDTRTPVTYAPGCRSWHVLGRAVDVNIFVNGQQSTSHDDYTAMGKLAEGLGWKWGGRFSGFGQYGDEGHVEWHPGLTIDEACPDPNACVDVVPTTPSSGIRWGLVAIGAIAITTAGVVGVIFARSER